MERFSLDEAARAVGGTVNGEAQVSGVFTDSRKPVDKGLFVALTGERFDGHDFIRSLENSGISAVLVERDVPTVLPKIRVKDTRLALLALAHYHREKFDIPVVGLTGSVGKTTTKEMIYHVLSSTYRTLKTEGNLNNDIGMPLTLLRLEQSHEAAVIEMGMNHAGEIARLTAVCRPTIGVITKIGVNHIENLGSRENILRAKLEIIEGMPEGAPLVVNGDDDLLGALELPDRPLIRFGITSQNNDITAQNIVQGQETCRFTLCKGSRTADVFLPCAGLHNVYNALCAAAVGDLLGIPLERAARALAEYTPTGMRQRISTRGGVTVIEDCYNASPDSVEAALKVLSAYRTGRRIAILGDMLELGDFAEELHRRVGAAAAENQVSLLYTYGPLSEKTADEAERRGVSVERFREPEALADAVRQTLRVGDAVLIKGSRAMKMEKITELVFSDQ